MCDNTCYVCYNDIPEGEKTFRPCECGFRICSWCFHTIVEKCEEMLLPNCPGCRAPYDLERIQKQKPPPQSKRPPRRAHATKSALSELVLDDGVNVALYGLPLAAPLELPSAALPTQQWLGRYGRVLGSVTNAEAGAAVCRFQAREDAQRAVALINGTAGHASVFVVHRAEELDEHENDQDEKSPAAEGKGRTRRAVRQPPQPRLVFCEYRVRAAAVPTRYCQSFLNNSECRRPQCVEVHRHVPQHKGMIVKQLSAGALSIFGDAGGDGADRRLFARGLPEWRAALHERFKAVLGTEIAPQLDAAVDAALHRSAVPIVLPLFPPASGVDELRVTTK